MGSIRYSPFGQPKAVHLLMPLLLVQSVLWNSRGVRAGFFEFTDFEDPLALLWETKDVIMQSDKKGQCAVRSPDSTVKNGLCIHPLHCYMSGGTPHGFCGVQSTCCTYERSCGKTTKSKVSYFNSGTDALQTQTCDFSIHLEPSNICQVRLDFEEFRLAPATLEDNAFQCVSDSFVIQPNTFNIPELCGINDNQHLYIHLKTLSLKEITLKVRLANRINNNLFKPSWRIKVTQLECPGEHLFKDFNKNAQQDFEILAPLGAIQYFTEQSGIIRSFGFNSVTNENNVQNNLGYGIAFRRLPDVCGVKFTTKYMNLPYSRVSDLPYTDIDCNDYLFVPALKFIPMENENEHLLVSKVCYTDTKGNITFTSTPKGPLYIDFVSGNTYYNHSYAYGFNLRYEMLTNC